MCFGGEKKTVKEDRETKPWEPTIAPMTQNIADMSRIATPDMFKPIQSASTLQGIAGLEKFARGPHTTNTAIATANDYMKRGAPVGLNELIATARGDHIGKNPYLDEMIRNQSEDLSTGINGMFSGSGRLGSGANQALLADRLGRLNTETRMNDYNTERGYQVAAGGQLAQGGQNYASMSPGLDEASMAPAKALLAAGDMRDQYATGVKQAPLSALDYKRKALLSMSGVGGTSNSTQTESQKSNALSQILGGAMMAGKMAMGMPPIPGFNPSGFGFGMPS